MKFYKRNLNDISMTEKNKIIDHIVEIARALHISGIQVAERLNMPNEIMFMLRERSDRVAMTSPCPCPECNHK